jgi:hypothetical protein
LADALAWLQVQLLCDAGADTGALVDGWGCTALFLAAHNGFGDVAQVLVDAGAAVDVGLPSNGCSPLFVAAESGCVSPQRGRAESPLLKQCARVGTWRW